MTDTIPLPPEPRATTPKPSEAAPVGVESALQNEKPRPDPVRYGDWEKNGRCIDF